MTTRQQCPLQRSTEPADSLHVEGIDPPDAHIHRISEQRCASLVIARNAAVAARGFDALVIGHFQDGGVHELRAMLDIPVVGLGEASMHHAMQLGERFGLVTIDPGFTSFHRRQVRSYEIDAKFAGVRAMRTTVETYQNAFAGDQAQIDLVATEFERCAAELVEAGADVIIPSGGFPALLLWAHDVLPDLDGATVLDPIGLTVGQAELWARLGPSRVRPGRRGPFARPAVSTVDEFVTSVTGMVPVVSPDRTSPDRTESGVIVSGVSRIGHARWTGPVTTGQGAVSAESGAFTELPYTFASRTSQVSELTDPEELLGAAHAGCFAMSLSSVLTEAGNVPVELAVSAEVTVAPTKVGRRITLSVITVEAKLTDLADESWFAEQVAAADERCPFSALIREAGTVTATGSLR